MPFVLDTVLGRSGKGCTGISKGSRLTCSIKLGCSLHSSGIY